MSGTLKRFRLILAAVILTQLMFLSQPQCQAQPILTYEQSDYRGYDLFLNRNNLTPIERIMESANFCEIINNVVFAPNFGTNSFENRATPIVTELKLSYIHTLLKGDVINFFSLGDKYNTPLKLKRFTQSDEYRDLKQRMDQEKDWILNHTFYAIGDVDSEFDLETETFSIGHPYYGRLRLQTPDKHFGDYTFKTPKMDEDTAYKIECNPSEIFYLVKFTDTVTDDWCFCTPVKVYIADKRTGEIYYEYTPLTAEEQMEAEKETLEGVFWVGSVEQQAQFPGGNAALYKFLSTNINYPKEAQENNVQGRVVVQFVVERDGSIGYIRIAKGITLSLDKEAIRIVMSMPKWLPARNNGVAVRSWFVLPITFRLSDR